MKNILALDLGQHCGWAMSIDGKIKSGVWTLTPSKFESKGAEFLKFKRHIELEIVLGGVEKIYFEAVRAHRAIDAAHAYGGYFNILRVVCIENDIPFEGIPVKTIKKHGTGNGNADKKLMLQHAIKKFKGTNVIDDNHADALHLLDYVKKTLMVFCILGIFSTSSYAGQIAIEPIKDCVVGIVSDTSMHKGQRTATQYSMEVLNPKECPNKKFVKYMNCSNGEKKEECK